MKAKELAEELLKNPEFEVEFRYMRCDLDSPFPPDLIVFGDVAVTDIGHSDQVIVLGGEEE